MQKALSSMLERLREALHGALPLQQTRNTRKRRAEEEHAPPDRYPKRTRKVRYENLAFDSDLEELDVLESAVAKPAHRYIAAIDVGIVHLGFCVMRTNRQWKLPLVEVLEVIDLRTLTPAKELAMRTVAFLERYAKILDRCESIIIERQPPGSQTAVEQLLYLHLSERATLLSPNTLHKHFRLGRQHGHSYESRKEEVVSIAERYLLVYATTDVYERYCALERKHDAADAVCMLIHTVEERRKTVDS